jgi:hypothetical protein
MSAKLWQVGWEDLLKGLFLAVVTPVLTIILQTLQAGSWVFDWKTIGAVAVSALLAYLIKQFGTDSQGTPMGNADKK